jgi:carbamoyltransferase
LILLGLNAYHGDSSACILVDGRLIAAVEEERLCRIKHWAGFPSQAIRYCLSEAGCTIHDVQHVAVNRNPTANLLKKALFALGKRPALAMITDRLKNASKIRDVKAALAVDFGLDPHAAGPQVHHVEHHLAHLASAFLVSPWEQAAVVSVDGFGDFVGAMWGFGSGKHIEVRDRIYFPHSLGLLYLAITQYLGFPHYGDEFKVMGLAAYGEPTQAEAMRRLVQLKPQGRFELGLDYFLHHSDGVTMTWDEGAPKIGPVFSPALEELLGPARDPQEPLTQRHQDIAASLQQIYEEAFFHLLQHVGQQTDLDKLCLAGGCAMNSVANGKIIERTRFKEIYIPPAPGDAGGAVGAAFQVWHDVLNQPRAFEMSEPYWGPGYGDPAIEQALAEIPALADASQVEKLENDELCRRTAEAIASGLVVGWYQGRMEWGPRALGNRSILVDPRRSDMKDILNARIKRRESFRPFAPAILEEATDEYFEQNYPDPYMSKVYKIRPEKRAAIPAAVHVDGTGRLQTVRREHNPRYWQVIDEFRKITGVPIVINTSFNENEPIVNLPAQAVDCFLRTKMDVLVVGSFFCQKKTSAVAAADLPPG